MSRHVHTLSCPCCGTPERDGGCVRQFACDCRWRAMMSGCPCCHKCLTHCRCEKNMRAEIAYERLQTLLESLTVLSVEVQGNALCDLDEMLGASRRKKDG